jgi:hypothetical protein
MILFAIFGLVAPGYVMARALRAPWAWAAAFPLSALVLGEAVIGSAIVGAPIRFGTISGIVLGVTAVAGVISLATLYFRRNFEVDAPSANDASPRGAIYALTVVVAVLVVLVLAGTGLRTALYPLSGADTPFRWEALAREMLQQQSLDYYPPMTAEDFTLYTYPDGIPPLVSSVYWWLYAARGTPWPAITSVAIVLEQAACFALVFLAARTLFGVAGGVLAVATLASSTLFNSAVAIGQDTGYTALSCAGQLAFAFAAAHRPRLGLAIMTGLFAALAAIARDYGPALALCGLVALAADNGTRKYVPVFCVVVIALGAPWYLRNWTRTGNPLYSLNLAFGFPVNKVHAQIMRGYRDLFGLQVLTAQDWARTAQRLIGGAPLVLLAGLSGIAISLRRGLPLAAVACGGVLLWLWSVRYTSGGLDYSMRVLTPTWVALSIGAGAWGPWITAGSRGRTGFALGTALLLIFFAGGYAAIASWAHPRGALEIREAVFSRREFPADSLQHWTKAIQVLRESELPSGGVLTDDCFFAVALGNHSRFRPVMAWSPEVAFLFGPMPDKQSGQERLRQMEIRYASFTGLHDAFWEKYPYFVVDRNQGYVVRGTAPEQPILILPPE